MHPVAHKLMLLRREVSRGEEFRAFAVHRVGCYCSAGAGRQREGGETPGEGDDGPKSSKQVVMIRCSAG
jgi:hypothetical protein